MSVRSHAGRGSRLSPWLLPATVLLLFVAIAAAVWMGTPLHDMTIDDFVDEAERLAEAPLAPFVVLGIYVVGVFLLVPLTAIIAATGVVFGAWPGVAYAFIGSMLAAILSFGVGTLLGGDKLRRIAGRRVDDLSRKVARTGVRAVLAIRLVPVAPFIVVNLVAGASAIRLRDYAIGTAIGLTPGILIKVVFADQLAQAFETSDDALLTQLGIAAVALIALGWLLKRGLRRWAARQSDDEGGEQEVRALERGEPRPPG
ncbi:TVP38/TMEM64 family protein [Verticiella sediminum]|uniref:TVP38/TMEM64 family membrane protein n=1 Tax=Verticiella sediminum TaxID=1247510 RepID=A0A556AKM6_9BURK|nr:TVP38/TMEM64 family protein [Verticiella sediminum]TSH93439.1 TVP38/TMEM64 family protein [Verticiella sediminum]